MLHDYLTDKMATDIIATHPSEEGQEEEIMGEDKDTGPLKSAVRGGTEEIKVTTCIIVVALQPCHHAHNACKQGL